MPPAAAAPALRSLPPVDPQRFVPTRERPVRAKRASLRAGHRDRAAQPCLGAGGDLVVGRGAHHRRPRHLPRAGLARGVDPAARRARGHRGRSGRAAHAVRRTRTPAASAPACARPRAAWRGCRVLEVSALLRELVLQLDIGMDGRGPLARGAGARAPPRRAGAGRTAPRRPGAAGRRPAAGQAPARAVRSGAATTRRATPRWKAGRARPAPARAPWRGCSASSSAPPSARGASRCCWRARCRWRRRAGRWG